MLDLAFVTGGQFSLMNRTYIFIHHYQPTHCQQHKLRTALGEEAVFFMFNNYRLINAKVLLREK